jgi:tetratricopeptide (TPR) repeat protein
VARAAIVLVAGAMACGACGTSAAPARPTDYDAELAHLDNAIAAEGAAQTASRQGPSQPQSQQRPQGPLQEQPQTPSPSQGQASGVMPGGPRIATPGAGSGTYFRYLRASLTGRPADAEIATRAITQSLQREGPSPDLLLLQANLALREHRIPDADRILAASPDLAASPQGRVLRADLDLQYGRYAQSRAICEEALRKNRTWDTLARLAFLTSLRGDFTAADALYADAEEEITAKEMRAFAWVELQRGLLQFNQGRYDQAQAHYRRAEGAYSGYWLVDDFLGELAAAQGRFDEAAARFEKVAERVPRADLKQRLGDLYVFMGRVGDATRWHDAALAGYLESTQRGEVQFYHHLAAFYADVRQDGPAAVAWARKDLALRESHATWDALAWALYRNNQPADALTAITHALATNVRDAHLLVHAATINIAAGRPEEGRRLLEQAAAINPHYEDFHIHR